MDNFIIQDFGFIAISIASCFFAVICIFWILNSSPISNWFKESEGITVSFITVPAFLFGLSISSFSAALLSNHQSASASIVNEANAVTILTRISNNLPTSDKDKLANALNNYVNSIITQEWPAMRNAANSDRDNASLELVELSNTANAIAMQKNQSQSLVNRIYTALDTLHHERLLRLSLAHEFPSIVRWPSMFVLSFLLLFTVGLLQLRSHRAMKISLALGALCIGSSMIFLLANLSPYRGLNAVKPDALKASLKLIEDSHPLPPATK